MAFFKIISYKEGLEIQQMAYLLNENEMNTTLILAHLKEHNGLQEEGGRYFLTTEAFEHGKKAFKDIRQEQIEKIQKEHFTDERDETMTKYVVHDFLTKIDKINKMREEPKDELPGKSSDSEVELEEAEQKSLPAASTSKKSKSVKEAKSSEGQQLTLENLAVKRLEELYKINNMPASKIMPFVEVFSRLCSLFSITKDDAWSLLFSLEKQDLIEIVPYHGITLKL